MRNVIRLGLRHAFAPRSPPTPAQEFLTIVVVVLALVALGLILDPRLDGFAAFAAV